MGTNTITQAFEKADREKKVKRKRNNKWLCLSLGLNIFLIVLILTTASSLENNVIAAKTDSIEEKLLLKKTLKELKETNEILAEAVISETPRLITKTTHLKTIMSLKRLTKNRLNLTNNM